MPYRIILISSDRARTSHILTLADPKVETGDVPIWGASLFVTSRKSSHEGLGGVIVAARPDSSCTASIPRPEFL